MFNFLKFGKNKKEASHRPVIQLSERSRWNQEVERRYYEKEKARKKGIDWKKLKEEQKMTREFMHYFGTNTEKEALDMLSQMVEASDNGRNRIKLKRLMEAQGSRARIQREKKKAARRKRWII